MWPVPVQSARNVYLNGLQNGKLMYQFDRIVGVPVFFPREVGPSGRPEALEWRESAGLGTVYSMTRFHPRSRPPYSIAIVELDEGFRLMSTVLGAPSDAPIGTRVRANFETTDTGPRVVFEVHS